MVSFVVDSDKEEEVSFLVESERKRQWSGHQIAQCSHGSLFSLFQIVPQSRRAEKRSVSMCLGKSASIQPENEPSEIIKIWFVVRQQAEGLVSGDQDSR